MLELRDPGGNAVGRAVVEQAMPARGESPSGEQDGQLGLLVGHRLGREFEHGPAQPPVFAFLDVEGQASQSEPAPLGHELRGHPAVQGEVHRTQLVGVERPGVLQGPRRGHVQTVDQHHDDVPVEHPRRRRLGRALFELVLLVRVLAMEPQENEHAERQDDQDDPGPLLNFATAMITSTMNESTEAVPLMASRRLQWSSRCFR